MSNEKNLRPQNTRTKEQQREIARKGGKASAAAARARKTLREELLALLAQGQTQERLSLALIEKALLGDVRAFEVIRDSIGEKPTDRTETKLDGGVSLTIEQALAKVNGNEY